MKALFLILLISLLAVPTTFADEWTDGDTYNQLILSGLTVVDWSQTQQIVKHPEEYCELNPKYGNHPSMRSVNIVMLSSLIVCWVGAYLLPNDFRKIFQYTIIGFEACAIANNYNRGLRIGGVF